MTKKEISNKNSKTHTDFSAVLQSRRNKIIHPWWQKLAFISLKRHLKKLDLKTKTIKELKYRLAQLTAQTKDYKQRLSTAGKVGTSASEKKLVVAGPYFCTPGSLKRLQADLNELFSKKLGEDRLPNPQQWEMILSENPSTCVNAGAGSGKSTTLILRLYVMREYLRIPWEHISVFTFTRYSRWDLIDKLVETFKKLDAPITQIIAQNVVRTFHSYALLLETRSTGKRHITIFDLIGKKMKTQKPAASESEDEETDFSKDEIFDVESSLVDIQDYKEVNDDKFLDEELDDKQGLQEELKAIYHRVFDESEKFRNIIRELFLLSISQSGPKKDDTYQPKIDYLNTFDSYATQRAAELFGDIANYADVLDLNIEPMLVGEGNNTLSMLFHARVSKTNQLILLVPENSLSDEFLPKRSITLSSFFASKRKFLVNFSDILPLVITSQAQLGDLVKFLRHYELKGIMKAPAFDYVPDGEFTKAGEAGHIANRFFSLIQFVENFGLDFQSWAKHVTFHKLSKGDQYFVVAAWFYHQYYCIHLKEKNYVSYNELFLKLQTNKPDLVIESDQKIRERMTHVLIDEFQDITPLYADYVKAIKQSLVLESGQAGSLLVVGDDFQSIYGWKGSTVDFILGFGKHFDTYEQPLLIKMENNHRCSQPIIHFAESIIEKIPPAERTDKKGIAVPQIKNPFIPRVFVIPDKNFIQQIVNFIKDEAKIVRPTSEHPMLILSRTNSTLSELKSFFKNDDCIKMMTFHASKGLEGRSVVLVGDCQYNGTNWIKNDVLRQHFKVTAYGDRIYDRMQKLETLRLAYVAATRAARRCHWIFKEADESRLSELHSFLIKKAQSQPKLFDFIKCSETARLIPMD